MKLSPLFLHLTSLAALVGMEALPAQTTQTWLPAGPDDFWNVTSLNWDAGAVWTDNNNAIFGGTADTIDVTVPVIINDLTFDSTGYTISSTGAGSFALGNDLGSTITVTNAGDTATVNETIANSLLGASTLTKAGPGTLTLSGVANNTYSGGTFITAGTLAPTQAGQLGTGAVTNNGTLNLNFGTGVTTPTGLSTGLSGAGTVNVTLPTGTNTMTLSGNYSGFQGIWNIGIGAAAGAGKVQMNGADNVAASINVLTHGTVFSTGAGVIHRAAITLNGGDTGESLGQLRLDNGVIWTGAVTLAGAITDGNDGFVGANAGVGTISGVISETGGAQVLSRSGAGTTALEGMNTYSGGTHIRNGAFSVSVLNNTGNPGNLGTAGTINFGSGATAGQLIYTGAGETTDRVINLAGTIGGATVNQSAAGGLLKLSSAPTVTGVGGKTLTLSGSTAGTGEVSASIGTLSNNGANLATTASAAFITGLGSITVNSVSGVVIGAGVAGTGIAAGTRVTSITGAAAPFTIGLSANTNAAGTINQAITFTAPAALGKTGTGTWILSGNNTYLGTTSLTGGILTITHPNALGDISGGTVQSGAGELRLIGGLVTAAEPLSISGGGIGNAGALRNFSGDNTYAGPITMTAQARINSDSGTLTLSAAAPVSSTNLTLVVGGAGNLTIPGTLAFGTGGVAKDGTGTLTLGGTNTYTGVTSINVGTLRLDYGTNDTSKLSDTAALNLGGCTVDLAGGSHPETVLGTTLTANTSSTLSRSSGGAVLQLNTVTPNGGTALTLTGSGIATTDNLTTNGILGFWARTNIAGVSSWATSGGTADSPIVPFTGYTDISRFLDGTPAGTLPNSAANHVRIINGGTTGNITPSGGALTQAYTLQMDANSGPALIDPVAAADVLNVGDNTGGAIWQTAGAGGLTIGTVVDDGVLTSGDVSNTAPALLRLINDSTANPLIINSVLANNGTDVVGMTASGSGTVILNGNNTYGGVLTVASGATVILTGNNSGRPTGANLVNTVSGTLQLQANAGNTTAGVSSVLSNEQTAQQPLNLTPGSTLQLRGDSTVTFTGGNNIGGLNNMTTTIDVNQLTAAGTNNTLTISPGVNNYANGVTMNVTGGNGYKLAFGTLNGVGAAANITLNPTTASLTIAGYTVNPTLSTTLTLSGSAAGNVVTGAVANPATSGATTLTKTGNSTWELMGDNTYTGATTVSAGTLSLTGNRTVAAPGTFNIGNVTGSTGTLNITNGTFTVATTGSTFLVGNGTASTGILNQSGGNLTTIGNQLLIGNGTATGIYNLSGGTLTTVGPSTLGVTVGVNTGTTATFNLSGTGTLIMPANSVLQICRSDNSAATGVTGTFNQTGGTATVGVLQIGGSNTTPSNNASATATLSLSGGTFSAVTFNQLSGANASNSTINIGGTADVTLPAFPVARGTGATATLNFDGGTLRPSAASATYLGGLTNAFIKAGGARFDVDTGKDITVSQGLLTAPASTGGGLTKAGDGTLTLSGSNTYTGTTAVTAGALAFQGGSQASPVTVASGAFLGFTLGSPTVSTGSVAFAAGSKVRITGIAVNPASYTLMTAASFSGTPVLETPIPGYELAIEGGTVLKLKPAAAGSGFADWAARPAFGLAPADQDATDDPDNDGVQNLVEYSLNGNPSVSDPSILPVFDASGANIVFTFQRLDDSMADTTQTAQFGSDLMGWTNVIIPASSAVIPPATITVTNGTPADTISISFPKPAAAVTGKYFARLKVTKLP